MSDILSKRRAPARPAMKSAILTSEISSAPTNSSKDNTSQSPYSRKVESAVVSPTQESPNTQMKSASNTTLSKSGIATSQLKTPSSTSKSTTISHTPPPAQNASPGSIRSSSITKTEVSAPPVATSPSAPVPVRTRPSLMTKQYNYDKKKYSPLCITRMPGGYKSEKISLIQELRSKVPDMYDLLYVLKTRPKSLTERDPNELTVLQLACSSYTALTISHRISFCRQLMALYPKAIIQRDSDGQTALHHALQITPAPSLRLVRSLLACDPSCAKMKDSAGSLPLHVAVMGTSSNAIIKMLVMAYPDGISVQDGTGTTALEYVQSRLKSPSESTVALLSVDGVWARPDIIMSVDVAEPDPEETYAAAFLQAWYKKLHAPKLLTFKYPKAQQSRHVSNAKAKQPTKEVALSSWEHDAAVTIQALVRGACLRLRFRYGVRSVTTIQRIMRGCIVRSQLHKVSSKFRALRTSQRRRAVRSAEIDAASISSAGARSSGGGGAGDNSARADWDQPDRHDRLGVAIDECAGAVSDAENDVCRHSTQGHKNLGGSTGSNEEPTSRQEESETKVQRQAAAASATSRRDLYVENLEGNTLPVMYEGALALVVYLGLLIWINFSPSVDEALHRAALDFSAISRPASVFAHLIVKSSVVKATRMHPSFVIPEVGSLSVSQAALAMTVVSLISVCFALYALKNTINTHRADSQKISSSHRRTVARSLTACSVLVTITWSLYALWLDAHLHAVFPIMATVKWDVKYVLALSFAVVPIAIYPIVATYSLLSSAPAGLPTHPKRKLQ
jgi:hypothetical protein